MSENKITKRDYFTAIRKVFENYQFDTIEDGIATDDVLSFIDHELELLARRSAKRSIPTKAQQEAAKIKTKIFDVLDTAGVPMTIAEIMNTEPEYLGKFSNQKIAAQLTKLINESAVEREVIKGVNYYKVITE